MTQYPTCRHIKEDGSYCGSPALRDRPYCYYHLAQRGRRLRRARALRDNLPYQLDIPALDNLYAIRIAVTEIVQALGSGQLDPRVAGKMLYGIQQASAINRRIEKLEAAQAKDKDPGCPVQASGSELERGFSSQNHDASIHEFPVGGPQLPSVGNCGDLSRIHDYPGFEKDFGLEPGADVDAETNFLLRKAEAEAELRQPDPMPTPPPGLRPGSAAYRIYREEAYQTMQMQLNSMRAQLREYNEMKRQQFEKEIATMKKEVTSAPSAPARSKAV